MDQKPEAAVAPETKTEATPNTNLEPAKEQEAPAAPDMHGFTSEQLADMQKFFQANGGYDKVKSKISNPTPAPAEEQKPVEPAQPVRDSAWEDSGTKTQNEALAEVYFQYLATKPKYAAIADAIMNGTVVNEMTNLGIPPFSKNGVMDKQRILDFLDFKMKNMPAKQPETMPEASAAPTVDYIPVGDKINNINEAKNIIMQDLQLRRSGQPGHPSVKMAEDYLRENLSKSAK